MGQWDEDEVTLWWDIIEEAMNQRTDDLKCPCDKRAPIEAEVDEHMCTVRCTECGKFVESMMPY